MSEPEYTLRRATVDDAAQLASIGSHPDVLPQLLQLPYGSEERWRQMIVDQTQPGRTDLMLVAVQAGRVLGSAGLHPAAMSQRRRHAAMLGISVSTDAQGRGVGRALMQALCDYADQWAQILRIELAVFSDNERAIRLYRRFDFEHEGRHRGYALRKGMYADVDSMARLHPCPPSLA